MAQVQNQVPEQLVAIRHIRKNGMRLMEQVREAETLTEQGTDAFNIIDQCEVLARHLTQDLSALRGRFEKPDNGTTISERGTSGSTGSSR